MFTASEEDLWSLRGGDSSPKSQPAPATSPTSPWITTECNSSNNSSNNSSSSDDGYKTEVGEHSQTSPFTDPTLTSNCSSKEIIEGLEREMEWLQHTLEEAEKDCEEVS